MKFKIMLICFFAIIILFSCSGKLISTVQPFVQQVAKLEIREGCKNYIDIHAI